VPGITGDIVDIAIGKIIELVIRALPYPEQVRNLFVGETDIRFDWRGTSYSISKMLHVEEVGDGVLIGSDKALLIQTCIKLVRVADAQAGVL
jgi:hypothetical protein